MIRNIWFSFCRILVVNKAVVQYFLDDLDIRSHFDAFRKFLLLEDGEFGHSLCSQLFQKVRTILLFLSINAFLSAGHFWWILRQLIVDRSLVLLGVILGVQDQFFW